MPPRASDSNNQMSLLSTPHYALPIHPLNPIPFSPCTLNLPSHHFSSHTPHPHQIPTHTTNTHPQKNKKLSSLLCKVPCTANADVVLVLAAATLALAILTLLILILNAEVCAAAEAETEAAVVPEFEEDDGPLATAASQDALEMSVQLLILISL